MKRAVGPQLVDAVGSAVADQIGDDPLSKLLRSGKELAFHKVQGGGELAGGAFVSVEFEHAPPTGRVGEQGVVGVDGTQGEKLVVNAISQRYQVSPMPIREALAQLEQEGLVQSAPHRGAWVHKCDYDQFYELIQVSIVLHTAGRIPMSIREHGGWVEALDRRDGDACAELCRQHRLETYFLFLDYLKRCLDHPEDPQSRYYIYGYSDVFSGMSQEEIRAATDGYWTKMKVMQAPGKQEMR